MKQDSNKNNEEKLKHKFNPDPSMKELVVTMYDKEVINAKKKKREENLKL